mgnify:FL=1
MRDYKSSEQPKKYYEKQAKTMHKSKYTGQCTRVMVPWEHRPDDLELKQRCVKRRVLKDHNHFEAEKALDFVELDRMLGLLQEQIGDIPDNHTTELKPSKPCWRDQVNHKRVEISKYYHSACNYSVKKVAELTGSNQATVKAVFKQLQIRGRLVPFQYNNQLQQQDLTVLGECIDDPRHLFYSVPQIKRIHPRFSKKAITRQIKLRGYTWKRLKRTPARPDPRRRVPHPDLIHQVVSTVVTGLFDDDKAVYFVDEFKLPLFQTPDYSWSKGDDRDYLFNSRPDTLTYTGIVMCSIRGFEAYQIYTDEVNSRDFQYFMQEAILRLPTDKAITVVMDQATWHTAQLLRQTDVHRFFCFNAPGVFQLNMIENAFSAIRSDFRKRAVTTTTAEELCAIADLFSWEVNEKRFVGYYKNYLRSLRRYAELEEFE